jgi:ubiquinone/menaquinone biosynthesis C-methylase UbiE
MNINFKQLKDSVYSTSESKISFVNATSTAFPFADHSADRVIALESAQHFKPLEKFVLESKRTLEKDGIFVVAIPVTRESSLLRLGILSLTWSSEHYTLDKVKSAILVGGFKIKEIQSIGHHVYEPLTDYYIQNRKDLKPIISSEYPAFVENILFKSLLKMKQISESAIIDYVLIKCTAD